MQAQACLAKHWAFTRVRQLITLTSSQRHATQRTGDLKFIFESKQTVAAFAEAVPKLLRTWNVTDTNARKLVVELKENAIVRSHLAPLACHAAFSMLAHPTTIRGSS